MSTDSDAGDEQGPTWDDLPDILTVEETARFLRCSRMTLYEDLHSGRLPYILVNQKAWRISKKALAKFIAGE